MRDRPRIHRRGDLGPARCCPAYSFMPAAASAITASRAEADFKNASPIDREDEAKKLLDGGGLRPGQAAAGRAPLQHDRQQPQHRRRHRRAVEGDRRRDLLHQHRRQDPLRLSARRRRFRRRALWLDRRLFRPAELPVPVPERQYRLQLRQVQQPGIRRADEAGGRGDSTSPKRAAILREADAILSSDMPWIPIMYYSTKNLVSPKLVGLRAEPARRDPDAVPELEGARHSRA